MYLVCARARSTHWTRVLRSMSPPHFVAAVPSRTADAFLRLSHVPTQACAADGTTASRNPISRLVDSLMEGSAGGGGQMKGPSRRDFGPQQQGGGMMRRPPGGAAAAAHAHAQAHAQAQGMIGPMMGPGGNASHPQQVGLSVCLRACEVRRFRCNDSGLEGIPGLQGSNAVLDCVQNASPGHMCKYDGAFPDVTPPMYEEQARQVTVSQSGLPSYEVLRTLHLQNESRIRDNSDTR